jgi:hypothetical protein
VRPVRGSELVAMVDPGAEVTMVSIAEQPRGHPSRSSHAGHHSVESQLPQTTAGMRAAYVRASLCALVSCPYAWGAYAWSVSAGHMCLLCWRLVRLVRVCSLSDKTKPGR